MIMTGMVKLKCHLPDFFLVDKELDVDIQSTCSRVGASIIFSIVFVVLYHMCGECKF